MKKFTKGGNKEVCMNSCTYFEMTCLDGRIEAFIYKPKKKEKQKKKDQFKKVFIIRFSVLFTIKKAYSYLLKRNSRKLVSQHRTIMIYVSTHLYHLSLDINDRECSTIKPIRTLFDLRAYQFVA